MLKRVVFTQGADIGLIIIGNVVMSWAYACLMVPNRIINGGMTSLALILSHDLPWPLVWLNNGLLVVLLSLVALFLGRMLFLKSLLSSVVFSLSFTLSYQYLPHFAGHPLVALLVASVLVAFGYYACLSSHSSTVGVDVIALILKKYWPQLNLSHLIRSLNLVILAWGLVVYGVWSIAWGILFAFCYTQLLNWMLVHWSKVRA